MNDNLWTVTKETTTVLSADVAPYFSPVTGDRPLMHADVGPRWSETLNQVAAYAQSHRNEKITFRADGVDVPVMAEDTGKSIGEKWNSLAIAQRRAARGEQAVAV